MSQNASDIRAKLEQLATDMELLRRMVHGTDTETVSLGTPPVPTPSLRKMAKDIDARESAKADAVISGATDRINAEGAAQESRVLTAGEAQTTRVNEAGDTQFARVNAEGNAQFGRVNTEGNTQYARVNEAGEAQTVQVNTAGQTQHAAITTTANALLAEMGALGAAKKEDLTSTGAAFLLQISANGDAQNTRLTTTGAAEDQKLRATGDAQRIIVILEGDTQVQRLAESGDTLNATLLNLVREAAQSAKDAAQSASTAVDMTHVGPAGKGKFGFVRIGSGIDVSEEGEISVAFPAVVSTPAVGFPAVVGIGYEYELSMSAESAVYGANIDSFIIAVDEDYVREVPAVGNAATHTLPITGVSGTTGRIVVTAVDDLGNMSLDSVTTFQRNTVTIATPRVLSPVDAATDVRLAPLLTVQPMQVSGVPATFEHTQIQISTLEDFSICVLDTGEDAPYTTQHQLATDLQKNTVYHVRARHRATLYGWSAWSALSLFETMDCFVDVPLIYAPLNDITDVALRPTISVAAFTNTGPVDTPVATQIQLARDAAFADIVAQHDGGYVTTFAPAADLALLSPYFVRVRHKGARWDWSDWSQTTRFTTLNAYTQPAAVTYPANGAVGVPLLATLRVVDFANVGPADTATGTHLQVALDADFAHVVAEYNGDYTVAWTLATMLTKLTTYFVRARHKGKRWGWGQWGAVTAFTSEDAFVRTPTVTAPVNGSTGVALRPTVSFSAFANAGPVDNAISTHFQVARDAAFTNLIHDSGEGGYVTSWTPGGNLALNSPHYVRVRHKGVLWGWSVWSAVVGFTTLNAYVNAPTVTAPANNATGVALRPTITLSGFSNVGPADVGNGTQIQIALDAAFTNVVASYASAYTVSWVPGNNLGINTPYFVRARHSGATWGWSAWSGACKFQTLNVTLTISPITQPANGATGVVLRPVFKWAAPVALNQSITEDSLMIATDAAFANVVLYAAATPSREYQVPEGKLSINITYYARPYARGSITEYAFGQIVNFRTLNGWVNPPSLTSPTANATVAGDEVYFASSPFSVSHTVDTHVATEFALNKVVNGADVGFWNSGELTGANLLAFKANIPNFEEGVQYRAYVRHKGQVLGWGVWSGGVPVKLSRASVFFRTVDKVYAVGVSLNVQEVIPVVAGIGRHMAFPGKACALYYANRVDVYSSPLIGASLVSRYAGPGAGIQCVVGEYGYYFTDNKLYRLHASGGTPETILTCSDPSASEASSAGAVTINGLVLCIGRNGIGCLFNPTTNEKLIDYSFAPHIFGGHYVSRGFFDTVHNRLLFYTGDDDNSKKAYLAYTQDGRTWGSVSFPYNGGNRIETECQYGDPFSSSGLGDLWGALGSSIHYAGDGLNFAPAIVGTKNGALACIPKTKTCIFSKYSSSNNWEVFAVDAANGMATTKILDREAYSYLAFYK